MYIYIYMYIYICIYIYIYIYIYDEGPFRLVKESLVRSLVEKLV